MQVLEQLETPDGLFLERLEAFMQKSLLDVKAFSERESRPFEETRRYVAEWHSKFLFESSPDNISVVDANSRTETLRSALKHISHSLEALENVSGVQSFFVAVDPADTHDQGFLGGTTVGRDFWRGLRHGGDAGAKAFKSHCYQSLAASKGDFRSLADSPVASAPVPPAVKGGPSATIKSELYTAFRNTLRLSSGVRHAEMKWTNHERLSTYGVTVAGWPSGIPKQNPSSLNASQNKQLLELIQTGQIYFSPVQSSTARTTFGGLEYAESDAVNEVLAYMRVNIEDESPTSSSVSRNMARIPQKSNSNFQHSPLSELVETQNAESSSRKRLRTEE